ncbi:MAG: urease accessory protein UreD [Rikenellaceae bacterium]
MEAQIKLTVAQRGGHSHIRSLYTTPPFRVVSVGQLANDGAAYLMQMSTSPGVLSGDRYHIKIEVEDGARLQLKSQSYQRIYDMDEEAQQQMVIRIGDNAHFSQVAHPIVPHRNSAYFASTRVEMGENSSFLQGEIITCGRRHYGEEFEFREFSNSVELYHKGRLRIKDRVWLAPHKAPLREIGLLEGHTHQATLIYQTTQQSVDIRAMIDHLYNDISQIQGVEFGVSESAYPGFVLRLLGDGGEQLFDLLQRVQDHLWQGCR